MQVPCLLRVSSGLPRWCSRSASRSGQLRAADLIDLDDADTLTASASDEFIATTVCKIVAPPRACGTLPAVPVALGAGRVAVVRLFRPPQVA